jgi:hypothetical protein
MPGGGEGTDAHRSADRDLVAVADRSSSIGNLVGTIDEVPRIGLLGQRQAPGDVVVVDVGLEHVRDHYRFAGGEVEDAVDVTLRVDHQRHVAVVHQVAPVTQRRRLDRNDRRHQPRGPCGRRLLGVPLRRGRRRCHRSVPFGGAVVDEVASGGPGTGAAGE